jgi:hypothetical protein
VATNITEITHLVQLAITPAFLLTGVGAILGVLSNRISRIVDRRRHINDIINTGTEAADYELEINNLGLRSRTIHWAIYCCSLSAFSLCGVVFTIFISEIFGEPSLGGNLIAWLFTISMVSLTAAIALFMREIRLCYQFN